GGRAPRAPGYPDVAAPARPTRQPAQGEIRTGAGERVAAYLGAPGFARLARLHVRSGACFKTVLQCGQKGGQDPIDEGGREVHGEDFEGARGDELGLPEEFRYLDGG